MTIGHLTQDGWEKKGTYDEPRLSEIIANYEDIGFEVRKVAYDATISAEGCSQCMRDRSECFFSVYTRRREESGF